MPELHWIGKDKVINHHQDVPFRVLDRKYAYGADNDNMIIHGDNLDALKALLPKYEGRVKCIYIDPPYNTGNEGWVYNDNVNDPKIKKWLGEVVGREGEDLSRHDKWLCMMYPRLKLLQRLLADDGAIFISIDDNEQANLKLICDEIFGNGNFVGQICRKRPGGRQDSKHYAVNHEYVICYSKNIVEFIAGKDSKEVGDYPKFDVGNKRYYKTQLLRKWGSNSLRENRPNLYYSITAPDGTEVFPFLRPSDLQKLEGCWRWSASTMKKAIENNLVEFIKDDYGDWVPYEKIYASENGIETKKFVTFLDESSNGTTAIKQIFNDTVFDYPKSPELIDIILRMANTKNEDIILDSFAGSGTTAHAVLNMNKADGGNRKFILVEMENYAENITAERVRRVIDGYAGVEGTGGGFTFYELGEPLLFDDGNLNENIPAEKIYEYVWHTETQTAYTPQNVPYYLGAKSGTAYYFYYERGETTTLNVDFLKTITVSARYIIYADVCALSAADLERFNITFKKIPRDIARL